MMKILRALVIGAICLLAVAASAYYVFDPKFGPKAGQAAKSTGDKPAGEAGHGEAGHEHGGEGVTLTDAQVAAAGIELLQAGPRELNEVLRLNGIIQPNQETLVKAAPRFPGVVRSMRKRLGDKVKKDEILATVESNQSLTTYDLKAPMDGTIIDRDGTLGDFAAESRALFTIADLSTMWIDFAVYRRDFARVRVGDAVSIDLGDGGAPIQARIDYVSPLGTSDTQSSVARAVVPNDGRLRPGMFVDGRVVLSATPVEVAVKASALQTLEGKTVVFVREGETFTPREVELGHRDADWVEVKFGLMPGDTYAAKNSFVIKAEIGKGSAAHEH
ncbi:MAG: efflux RND transporter periplasmic adaptor subunit [Reyranella sp.]|jgi:cobalt-zinc-cadmium efflux system membrane fusion protein|uniref:divalent metal ion exporter adaptor subunit IhpB n=1 Tax=Reyranella sp. TaxID=1929291 RepID=UPI0025D7A552|nr:efflux RND transporter periplasmic adaptor subunit [Reyranella sp.]MBR2818582.1 efflux RND transporter periplasmic adaptor subunit [Reyranella sp.]